jgi:hypothetical protein
MMVAIRSARAEMEICFIEDGGKIKRQKNVEHHGLRALLLNICQLTDPSLVTIFEFDYL